MQKCQTVEYSIVENKFWNHYRFHKTWDYLLELNKFYFKILELQIYE